MIFPKDNMICEYEGKEYKILSSYLFKNVLVKSILKNDNINENSHFYLFNWWKFMLKAKFINYNKLSDAY